MSDQLTVQTQQAPRAPRVYTPVESVYGIMDTARFEHLGRVATVLAKAGLLPKSITHEKQGGQEVELPFETIQARAFLLANQADIWGADPLAVSQASGIVHGKLVYEGKLVHAVIEARLGIRLYSEFGAYDPKTRKTSGEMPTNPEDRNLGVRVWGKFEDEEERREIHGSVAMWHTGDKGPWQKAAEWTRQLRYMGARTWARAHSPGIVVGILTDTEVEERWERVESQANRRVKVDTAAKLAAKGEAPKNGFSIAHVIKETEAEEVAPKPAENTTKDRETVDAEGVGGGAEIVEAEGEEVVDDASPPAPVESVASAEATPASDPSPSPSDSSISPLPTASPDGGATSASPSDDDEWRVLENNEGPAPTGLVYLLASDEIGQDGKLPTYENGEPFSRAGQKGAASLPQYAEHPTIEQLAGEGGAQSGPEDVETGMAQGESGGDEGGNIRNAPEDRTEPERNFLAEMRKAESWFQIKALNTELTKTPEWNDASEPERDEMRRAIWATVVDLKKRTRDPVDHADDPSAFRLWLTTVTGTEGAEAIQGTLAVLKASARWPRLNADQQGVLVSVARAACEAVSGGG